MQRYLSSGNPRQVYRRVHGLLAGVRCHYETGVCETGRASGPSLAERPTDGVTCCKANDYIAGIKQA